MDANDPFVIRPYRPSDFENVRELWDAADLSRPWNPPERDIELCQATGNCALLLAERGEALAGTIMVGHDGHRGWIYYLAVELAERRSGLGSRLMNEAENWLKARGVPKVHLMIRNTNMDARDFYDAIGYDDNPVVVLQKWLVPKEN